jgi:zinc transport system permease protein
MQYEFLQRAVIAGLLVSLCCGVIGSYVVINRLSYMSGGIAHSVLAGVGIAYFLGLDPTLGALLAATVVALVIGWIRFAAGEHQDTLIGALWSVGMAVGLLFIASTPGYSTDLMSFLFGNILLVTDAQLHLMVYMCVGILLIVVAFYHQFHVLSFDPEFAELRGVPVKLLYLLLLCLIAVSTVLMMQLVGLILVIAMLTLPAAVAGQHTRRLLPMMILALLLGGLFTTTGTALSFITDYPTGSVIVLLAGVCYFLSTGIKRLSRLS